jgi:hypothetical protein
MSNRGVIGLRSSETIRPLIGAARPSHPTTFVRRPFGRHSVSRLGGSPQKERAALGQWEIGSWDGIHRERIFVAEASIKGLKFTDPMSESKL